MTAPTRLEQLEAERDAYRAEAMSLRAHRVEYTKLKADRDAFERRWLDHVTCVRETARANEAALKAKLTAAEALVVRLKIEVRALRRGTVG